MNYIADTRSSNTLLYGGMLAVNKTFNGEIYAYGNNSQLKVNEVNSLQGGHYTAEFWEYNPLTITRWNRDPKPNPSFSDYACFANNAVLYNDPLGDIVDYGKLGQGGLRNRINSGVARVFNKEYRNTFNKWKNSDATFHLEKTESKPSLKSGGEIQNNSELDNTVKYGGVGLNIEQQGIPVFGTKKATIKDNNSDNSPTTQTLNKIVPGTDVKISPLPQPDEFTFTNQSGGLVHQGTYVKGNIGEEYLDKPGFAPVTTLTNSANTSFKVPTGTTFLKVVQRSDNSWLYKDSRGTQTTEPNSNSQWNIEYTKYRFSLPVIR